jgi:hypothetical protein
MPEGPRKLTLAPLSETHSLYRQQLQILGSQVHRLEFVLPSDGQAKLDKELMAALRTRVLNKNDAYFACPPYDASAAAGAGGGGAAFDSISAQNEREALQLLRRLISEQVSAHSSLCAAAAAVDAAAADLCAPANEPNMQPLPLSDEVAANYSSWLREWNVSDAVALGEAAKTQEKDEDDVGLSRGVVALRDISARENVFKVPCKMLINVDTALKSEIGNVFLEARAMLQKEKNLERQRAAKDLVGRGQEEEEDRKRAGKKEDEEGEEEEELLHDDTIAMLFLLHERAKGDLSVWRRYFHCLPPSIYTALCPQGVHLHAKGSSKTEAREAATADPGIDWENEMAGTPLIARGKEELGYVSATYTRLFPGLSHAFPHVFKPEHFSYELFLWARVVFDTRCVSVRFGDGKDARDVTCLVPFADMCNHHR